LKGWKSTTLLLNLSCVIENTNNHIFQSKPKNDEISLSAICYPLVKDKSLLILSFLCLFTMMLFLSSCEKDENSIPSIDNSITPVQALHGYNQEHCGFLEPFCEKRYQYAEMAPITFDDLCPAPCFTGDDESEAIIRVTPTKLEDGSITVYIEGEQETFFIINSESQHEMMADYILVHNPVILTHQSGDIDPPKEDLIFGWRLYCQNYRFFLKLSPFSSILCDVWTNRSRMASAMVASPIISNQLVTGS